MLSELLALEILLLITVSYIGASIFSAVSKDEEDENKNETLIILLYGGVGWIAGFMLRAFEVASVADMPLLDLTLLFAALGMFSYMLMTLIVEEVKDKMIAFK